MNARIILGLVSVVLLSSGLVAGDRYSYNEYQDRDRSYNKHVKRDYDRGHHRVSYDKKRNNKYSRYDDGIRGRYTKQELNREIRRLEKKENRREIRRQDRRELKRLRKKEARKQARWERKREARRQARMQEQMRVSYYDNLHNNRRHHSIDLKAIFRLPPPPFFAKF